MLQVGTSRDGLCREMSHHSPTAGARHLFCGVDGDSGEILLLWGSLVGLALGGDEGKRRAAGVRAAGKV